MEQGYQLDFVLMDFEKIFDRVNNRLLLNTLSKYGIQDKAGGERWRGWPQTDNSGIPLSMPMLPPNKKAYVSK